ncbi:MAG: exopolysaccharide biosynthesis polyprenyl glycosylphosphotransferase [Gammaproteobacteria bacterium]|nr:exopolysaccharide biosynthesis polyprenyl glycosylphosphotransferase [Gammaproteobacteria bacterium]
MPLFIHLLIGLLAASLAYALWGGAFSFLALPYLAVTGAHLAFMAFFFQLKTKPFESQLKKRVQRLLTLWGNALIATAALLYLTGASQMISPIWLMGWFTLSVIGCSLVDFGFYTGRRQSALSACRIAIVGSGPEAQRLIDHLSNARGGHYQILGIFDDRRTERDREDHDASKPHPNVLGNTEDLIAFSQSTPLDRIIIALPIRSDSRIHELIQRMRVIPIQIDIYLSPFNNAHHDLAYEQLGRAAMLRVVRTPIGPWSLVVKRMMDLVLTSLALPFLALLCIPIALAIKMESKGPLLYHQIRGGYQSQRFRLYKFRTMFHSDEAGKMVQVIANDPRITRVGKILRRFSLDELPQLFNVFIGDLSLVGPRPHASEMDEEYVQKLDQYIARYRVKPGLTGWAQIHGLRGITDTKEKMSKRLRYDLYYIDHWSLGLDLMILLRTFRIVMNGRNAM